MSGGCCLQRIPLIAAPIRTDTLGGRRLILPRMNIVLRVLRIYRIPYCFHGIRLFVRASHAHVRDGASVQRRVRAQISFARYATRSLARLNRTRLVRSENRQISVSVEGPRSSRRQSCSRSLAGPSTAQGVAQLGTRPRSTYPFALRLCPHLSVHTLVITPTRQPQLLQPRSHATSRYEQCDSILCTNPCHKVTMKARFREERKGSSPGCNRFLFLRTVYTSR